MGIDSYDMLISAVHEEDEKEEIISLRIYG